MVLERGAEFEGLNPEWADAVSALLKDKRARKSEIPDLTAAARRFMMHGTDGKDREDALMAVLEEI